MPSAPISPSPRLAWRSRLEPSGVIESLTCSEPRRSQADDAVELVDHAPRAPRRVRTS